MKVVVIGAGIMGPGIALSWLFGDNEVVLSDINKDSLAKGTEKINESLELMQKKEIIFRSASEYLQKLSTTTNWQETVHDADLVIEAVAERPDIKGQVYNELDKLCPEKTVIVSNTSTMPLPDLFPDFRPGKFFICHYFNPPEIMPLVEMVINERTDKEVVEWLKKELAKCGKKAVVLNGYIPGFFINRVQTAMARETLFLVNNGIISLEDVDIATMATIGFKTAWQGSFDTMDYIGLDTVNYGYKNVFPLLNCDKEVPDIINKKVKEGNLGVKTGKGFYDWTSEKGQKMLERRENMLLEQLKLWQEAEKLYGQL